MFSEKHHINQLTSLLLSHGVNDVVVCPGSRNGAIVHNLFISQKFELFPVTDERSAAFVALGISLAKERPVAICVTSGSALLNTLPAVAEAFYRHIPLLVISADRPTQLIGQLDGQTIEQQHALEPYAKTFHVTESKDESAKRWTRRILNEALSSLTQPFSTPIHINIAINEPLFQFTEPVLPNESVYFVRTPKTYSETDLEEFRDLLKFAEFPIIVTGQLTPREASFIHRLNVSDRCLIVSEMISNLPNSCPSYFFEILIKNYALSPDLVIHVGGNFVNKGLKEYLRCQQCVKVVRFESGGDCPDTFGHLCLKFNIPDEVKPLQSYFSDICPHPLLKQFNQDVLRIKTTLSNIEFSSFSDLSVVKLLASCFSDHKCGSLHFANSSVVRYASWFFTDIQTPVFCNRGVNGIEGSLSTAVGHALAKTNECVFCFIGDLSFFYDCNALWNVRLMGNLRVVVFNNCGGDIFAQLPGLYESPAAVDYISAGHAFSAKGIAISYEVEYHSASSLEEFQDVLPLLFRPNATRPILVEVFTNRDDNRRSREELNNQLKTLTNKVK